MTTTTTTTNTTSVGIPADNVATSFEDTLNDLLSGVITDSNQNVDEKKASYEDNVCPKIPTLYLKATAGTTASSAKTRCEFDGGHFANRAVLAMSVFSDLFLKPELKESCGIPNQTSNKWTFECGRFGTITVVRNQSISNIKPFCIYEMFVHDGAIQYASTRCSSEQVYKCYPDAYGSACEQILDTIAPGALDKLGVFVGRNRTSTYRLNIEDVFSDSSYGGRGKSIDSSLVD